MTFVCFRLCLVTANADDDVVGNVKPTSHTAAVDSDTSGRRRRRHHPNANNNDNNDSNKQHGYDRVPPSTVATSLRANADSADK